MKIMVLALFILLMNPLLYCENYLQIKYLDRGLYGYNDIMGPFITDYNKNIKDELVIRQYNTINFYEYDEDSNFILIKEFQLDSVDLLWTAGIGDMDGDGLLEMLLRNPEVNTIFVYEQSDSISFFNTLTWTSDTTYKSLRYLGITNKLKGDGVDRIYGGGIPEVTTPTNGYGWYYFTCTGENQYEILNTFEESTRVISAMDIGDIDLDSLNEVVVKSADKRQI
ncbi:MAG: VCBS repeat-containing protein, partial [bacterium]|nr:VCBS repeat-containing protein [bacterium]